VLPTLANRITAMHATLNGITAMLLAILLMMGNACAQAQEESSSAPETIQGAPPASATAPQSIPGILLTPPRPVSLPSQVQPQTCPDTGQKLELIG
jgi:hypothetical protein